MKKSEYLFGNPSQRAAGGLRYHGMSPILSQLYDDGYMKAVSIQQTRVFEAAETFARTEGILPAPESSHAICAAIDEAMKCKETGEEKTILFGLSEIPRRTDGRLHSHGRGTEAVPRPAAETVICMFRD